MDPDCLQTIEQQLPEHRATVPPGADPKWRFFWRLGPRPEQTHFAELNAEPVIPAGKLSRWQLLPTRLRHVYCVGMPLKPPALPLQPTGLHAVLSAACTPEACWCGDVSKVIVCSVPGVEGSHGWLGREDAGNRQHSGRGCGHGPWPGQRRFLLKDAHGTPPPGTDWCALLSQLNLRQHPAALFLCCAYPLVKLIT